MKTRKIIALVLALVMAITTQKGITCKADSSEESDEFMLTYHNYETGEDSFVYVPNMTNSSKSENTRGVIEPPQFKKLMEGNRSFSYITNASLFPASCIVLIRFHISHETSQGSESFWSFLSGAMVYNDLVLTCAHGIYNGLGTTPVFADTIYVYPGYTAQSFNNNATHYTVSGRYTPYQYYSAGDGSTNANYDWTVLTTSTEFSGEWFGFGSAESISNKSVTSMGYPIDINNYYYMCETSGIMNSITSYRFNSTLTCVGGQSGSPVFDSNYIIWGVMTGYDINHNGSGCMMTGAMYSTIMSLR